MNDILLEKALNIKVTWTQQNRPPEDTGFQFTYKPNPKITEITPNKTIIR